VNDERARFEQTVADYSQAGFELADFVGLLRKSGS
jgi:hypothetical protein